MRWLGENDFPILPLLAHLRKPGVGLEDICYWIWDGERTDE